MVQLLKKFNLNKYITSEFRTWHKWARCASSTQRREAKPVWLKQGRAEPRTEKKGWLRFSFPHGYNSDLLEVLLLIAETDNRRDEIIDRVLKILIDKRLGDGTWKMVAGLNNQNPVPGFDGVKDFSSFSEEMKIIS